MKQLYLKLRSAAAFAVLLFLGMASHAQDFSGAWKGTLEIQGTEVPLVFHLEGEGEAYTATMDSPSQGATGIPVDKATVEDGVLTLVVAAAGIRYSGSLEGDAIKGTFTQAGMELPLVLDKHEVTLPGNPQLVTTDAELDALAALDKGDFRYTVEDYFARPKASTFRFSPDGKYLSYREKDEHGKRHIYVREISSGEITRAIEEKEELVRGYGWVNNDMLVYSMDKGGNENYHIYAVNLDGSGLKDLTPFDGVRASILELVKDDKDHIVVSMNQNNPQVFEPYRVNVRTGALEQLYANTDIANPIMGYDFDKDGNLRGYVKLRDGVDQDIYYGSAEDGFNLIKSLSWKDNFGVLEFAYTTPNPDDAYVLTNLESDKAQIVLYDMKQNRTLKKLFSNEQYDAGGMGTSRKRGWEIDYFAFEGTKQEIIPVSDTFKKLHERLTAEFPGKQYSIPDVTDEEDKLLIFVQSDRLYGTYYLYDVARDEISELYNLMPQLKEEDMAEMRPITFTSRDGVTLHGYITLPRAAQQGQKVPVIVNPHGGPQGIRDSWGFNPEAQLFASRGYATLQVNFRISGGYGREFLESGFKQIGRKAMDDVEDGLQYAIDQGWVDPEKVAIYGGSHGGYAVLRGLTKTPDLYTCGVDYVGVSNLFTFMKTIPPYWKPYLKIIKEIWYDEDVPEEKAIMEEVSPVYQIDRIEKPLLVAQGANDPRVNIDESDQIVEALRKKGFDVPYMVKYDEGHGFGKEENSIHLYKVMMGFYAKHLAQKELTPPIKG